MEKRHDPQKRYWLMKSEPDTYSLSDLMQEKNQVTAWEGVRNYQARNFLKSEMQIGDEAFFYHSSCATPGIVGIVEIVRAGYPDPSAFDPNSPYFDPKSQQEKPRWYRVDVKFKKQLPHPITLAQMKQNPQLNGFILTRPGNRLSVIPVTEKQWQIILAMNPQ